MFFCNISLATNISPSLPPSLPPFLPSFLPLSLPLSLPLPLPPSSFSFSFPLLSSPLLSSPLLSSPPLLFSLFLSLLYFYFSSSLLSFSFLLSSLLYSLLYIYYSIRIFLCFANMCVSLLPLFSGEYSFAISSADSSELWLSSDENPKHTQMIAYLGEVSPSQYYYLCHSCLHASRG